MKSLGEIITNQEFTLRKIVDGKFILKWRHDRNNFTVIVSYFGNMDHASISSPKGKEGLTDEIMDILRNSLFDNNERKTVLLHAKSDTFFRDDVWHLFRSQNGEYHGHFGYNF